MRSKRIVGLAALALLGQALLGQTGPLAAETPAAVAQAIGSLRLGQPQHFEGLTVIPLLGRPPFPAAGCATLEQALENGWLAIEEKDGGTVPEVWVSNRSERAVFLMGGEILSGARQDRIVRQDVLVGPRRKRLAVPVYCVEQGRWHFTTGSFGSEKNLGTFKLRAKARAGGPQGQSEVWAEVAKANDEAGVSSSTGAYQDAYRDGRVARRVEELERRLADLARGEQGRQAVGAAVGLGDCLVSLDLFADPSLFQELWPKILKSTALAAAAASGQPARVTVGQVRELLALLSGADWLPVPAVDLGGGLAYSGTDWEAGALVREGALLHLSAFPCASPAGVGK
jgi:hypothetical protein